MAPKSWLPVPLGSCFSLSNIPFGVITPPNSSTPHIAVAIDTHALDLANFSLANGFSALPIIHEHLTVFSSPTLNRFAALGRPLHRAVREYLQQLLSVDTPYPALLRDNAAVRKQCLIPLDQVKYNLPMDIGDYTDFYAGLHHAHAVGVMFRGTSNALQPNYTHLPVGYHGRASSVVVSGTPICRPWGQILPVGSATPVFGKCAKFDIELELGAFICKENTMGQPIPISEAEDYIFGYVLLNDWSARDIQAWEYVPLGPFGGKNFGTTISPWVVLTDALIPFLGKGIENPSGELLPYLRERKEKNIPDIKLTVDLTTKSGHTTTITQTTSLNTLWSFPQMLTHHSITGCPMKVGDLLGSGTISGTEPGTQGSLLEQSLNGKVTMKLAGGEERKFLEDGDIVTLRGICGDVNSDLVGFGDCVGEVMPAIAIEELGLLE